MAQLMRYALVGVGSNALIYFIYLLLTNFGCRPKIAMTLVYIIGTCISYIGNRRLTFKYHGNSKSIFTRYLIAHFFGYMLNLMILHIFVDIYGYPHQLVQAIAIIIVAGLLFLIFKYYVFHKKIE